jgi:hypothetical protein
MSGSGQVSAVVSAERFLAPEAVSRLRNLGLGIGVVAAAGAVAGYFGDPGQFTRSYLLGLMLWISLPLGCLALLMIQHLSGGDWGVVARRILEASSRTLWFFLILFVPLMIWGLPALYGRWLTPESELVASKGWYLNVPDFRLRTGIYFAVWIALAWLLNRLSRRQDSEPDPVLLKRMQAISAPGLIVYVLAATFASFDWLMSLTPKWYSTMYGVYFVGGHGLAALAFLILVARHLSHREPMNEVFAPRHFHDWGKLMFAFVILWAYFSISQFLIIWSGNLPDEISWYLPRFHTGWVVVSAALLIFHFGVPFVLLLSRDLKRHAARLAWVAVFLLVMRWLDLLWQIAPTFHPEGFHLSWMDVVVPLGIGGLWLGYFAWELARLPLLPVKDPYLEEALVHGH